MISFKLVVLLALTHWVADFVLQSNWMGLNKSKNTAEGALALTTHCGVYALCFLWVGVEFAAITFFLHLLTDAITSRITSKLWFVRAALAYTKAFVGHSTCDLEPHAELAFDSPKRHWFFVVIGFDQFLHGVCLVGVTQLYIALPSWVDSQVWRFL